MRLFAALDLSDEVRRAVGEAIEKFRPRSKGTRWVRPEGMHVTLKFIGEIDPRQLDPIRETLSRVQCPRAFDVKVRGVGFFPKGRRPRVIWCGIEPSSNLSGLAEAIDHSLEPLGIAREKRSFVPHLTLARFKPSERLESLMSAASSLDTFDFGAVRETEFYLYQSFLKPSGAEYKKLAAFPLSGESI